MIIKTVVYLSLAVAPLCASSIITPIPESMSYNKKKAELGEKLFFDTVLSYDKTVSCNSCHNLYTSGADNLEGSIGVGGKVGRVNAPTVYNSVFNFVQFWNGRAKSLKEQAKGPIVNPIEMANTPSDAVNSVKQNPKYKAEFEAIYKDGVTFENIADAIAEFEKTLITPNSRFDNYIKGDKNAINKQEKEGFELFQKKGCISCHNGVNIGGNMFQKIGVMIEYKDPKAINGRFDVSKKDSDKNMFKVPTLRNVELTAPYFHNGLVRDLEEAVRLMGYHQLGIKLKDEDVEKIVAFLKTLTGKKPTKYSK